MFARHFQKHQHSIICWSLKWGITIITLLFRPACWFLLYAQCFDHYTPPAFFKYLPSHSITFLKFLSALYIPWGWIFCIQFSVFTEYLKSVKTHRFYLSLIHLTISSTKPEYVTFLTLPKHRDWTHNYQETWDILTNTFIHMSKIWQ